MTRTAVSRIAVLVFVLSGCTTLSHAQGGSCKDPWINQAYNELYHRAPSGSGATGECNIALYGGGHWSSYTDLENKIVAVRGRPTAVQAVPAAVAPSTAFHLDKSLNLVNAGGSVIARAGSFNLVNSSGVALSPSAIVAQGGGNIVAQGGGNIVAQGGGNMRSVQSVDSRPTYVVK
jgi:hypothetical protein